MTPEGVPHESSDVPVKLFVGHKKLDVPAAPDVPEQETGGEYWYAIVPALLTSRKVRM